MTTSNITVTKIEFQFDVIRRYDHYINTTNLKIALLLSLLVAVLVGLLFRVAILAMMAEKLTTLTGTATALAALAILAVIGILVRAVTPRLDSTSERSFLFFGDVASWCDGQNQYYEDFSSASNEDLLKDLTTQSFYVATIASEKFRLIGLATKAIMYVVLPLLGINILILLSGC